MLPDYKGDIGIYAGPGSIHWQLDRAKYLASLYQSDSKNDPVGERIASLGNSSVAPGLGLTMQPSAVANASWEDAQPISGIQGDTEIIVIMRDRSRPESSRTCDDRHAAER